MILSGFELIWADLHKDAWATGFKDLVAWCSRQCIISKLSGQQALIGMIQIYCSNFGISDSCNAVCRVPEQCSNEVASLIYACISSEPEMRPTARTIIARLQELHPNA